MHDASSSAMAAVTNAGFIALTSRTTGRRSGTASSTVSTHTASTSTVSSRLKRAPRSSAEGRWRRCACLPSRPLGCPSGMLLALTADTP